MERKPPAVSRRERRPARRTRIAGVIGGSEGANYAGFHWSRGYRGPRPIGPQSHSCPAAESCEMPLFGLSGTGSSVSPRDPSPTALPPAYSLCLGSATDSAGACFKVFAAPTKTCILIYYIVTINETPAAQPELRAASLRERPGGGPGSRSPPRFRTSPASARGCPA